MNQVLTRLVLIAGFFLLFGLGGFRLFGPAGRWTDSVSDKPLRVRTGGNEQIQMYGEELRRKRSQAPPPWQLPTPDGSFEGQSIFYESSPEFEFLQTATGKYWTEGQHLYLRRGAYWEELKIPAGMTFAEWRAVLHGEEVVLLVSRWKPWSSSRGNFRRFLRSFLDRELRPIHGLYELKLPDGELLYLGPGHILVSSPDRRHVAFLRSTEPGFFGGFHSLHILDVSTYEIRTLAALREGDPGSGLTFEYAWSDDSKALFLWGWIYSYRDDVELVYTLDSDKFWDVRQ